MLIRRIRFLVLFGSFWSLLLVPFVFRYRTPFVSGYTYSLIMSGGEADARSLMKSGARSMLTRSG
jgi:hypothetical protein